MAKDEKQHELLTFLLVDIKQAGCDMIELAGEIGGLKFAREDCPWKLDDLERVVVAAQRAINNYRRALKTGRRLMTRPEFEDEKAA